MEPDLFVSHSYVEFEMEIGSFLFENEINHLSFAWQSEVQSNRRSNVQNIK